VVSRHFDDLAAILEFDALDDFWQLVFALQSPPCFRGCSDELEHHELGGLRRQGTLRPRCWRPLLFRTEISIDHFRGRCCLDSGCGAGRWTRTLLSLGASVKSVDVSRNGLAATRRLSKDVEYLDLFDITEKRSDLHRAFDFTFCWGVIMCTHDPKLAFENIALTAKPGGELYVMVYAPTCHASDYVLKACLYYHSVPKTPEERANYVYQLGGADKDNAINYSDMLNTFYNWTIDEPTIRSWFATNGFEEPIFLNATEPDKCAHHVVARKRR
jgi:SAM-dependent methyltransferase